jgi:hypothetical protein
MRKLTLIIALIAVFAISSVASAAVQSIRVSGEVNTYAIHRTNEDGFGMYTDDEAFLMSTIGLNFDVDLTENVAAYIALASMRDWDRANQGATSFDVGVAEAYITLSELLYQPLTLRIGAQPLYYGRGLIIGSNVQDPEVSIGADEYSLYDAFDAISATLDYAPWIVDLAAIKIDEGSGITTDNDRNVYFLNVGYDLENQYLAEIAGYFAADIERSTSVNTNEIYTIGARGSYLPIDNSLLFVELAHQFGEISGNTIVDTASTDTSGYISSGTNRDVDAWAAEVGGEYTWVDVLSSPKLGLKYTYLSGEENDNSGDYEAWTGNWMRKSDTAIYGWNGRIAGNTTADTSDAAASTNLHTILVSGKMNPLAAMDNEDVTLEVKYARFIFDEKPVDSSDDHAGDELDLNLTYNYTEDVEFGLLGAIFWPGDYYQDQGTGDSAVTEIVGSCKVTF